MCPYEVSVSEEANKSLSVIGLGIWTAGATDLDQFRSGVHQQTEPILPSGRAIEPRTRRRATPLSRAMADACDQAVRQANLEPSEVPTVFASALGEAPTMISLVDQMCRNEEMSPMRFATSVHSAAAAVVSISGKNKGFTTAISSDYDTVAMALVEVWGLVACSGEPVVAVFGDDHSPEQFLGDDDSFERLAVALAFAGSESPSSVPVLARLGLPEIGLPEMAPSELPAADVPATIARSPSAGAVDLLAAILGRRAGRLKLDHGNGSGLSVEISFG